MIDSFPYTNNCSYSLLGVREKGDHRAIQIANILSVTHIPRAISQNCVNPDNTIDNSVEVVGAL